MIGIAGITGVYFGNAGALINPYRPDVEGYCAFLDFYLTLFKPDTVKKYIRNINTAPLERAGYHMNAIPKLMIQRTFKAAAKRLGHVAPKTRFPLTLDILRNIKPRFNFTMHDDRMLWAILCVGFFTLARIGEWFQVTSHLGLLIYQGGQGMSVFSRYED